MRTPGSFLSGILFGMLAALGVVFLLMNDFNPSKLFSSNASSVSSGDTIVDLTNQPDKLPKKPLKSNTSVQIPTEVPTEIDTIQLPQFDSLPAVDQEEIIVKRDELLKTIFLDLITIGKSVATGKTDSILNSFQGGAPENPNAYRLEFWQSPVNFKGFKLIRNGIITFGLDPNESAKIFDLNGTLILRSGQSFYRVYPTDRFMPFQRISDENTIKQLRS